MDISKEHMGAVTNMCKKSHEMEDSALVEMFNAIAYARFAYALYILLSEYMGPSNIIAIRVVLYFYMALPTGL